MKISLLQMKVLSTPLANLDKIDKFLSEAYRRGTDIAVLPEICCCPYENDAFIKYAMEENDLFIRELSHYAKKYNLILVSGTVPEKTSEGIYNTSFVFDTSGKIIARHRKIHLFDINIENGQYFKESDTFLAGKDITKFDTKWGKIGLMICYDIRFPELSRLMADDVKLIIVPASFNFSTGPKHWELLFRARAVDNQVYMAGCSAATDYRGSYQSWGHSIITNPWGDVSKQLDNGEEILTENLDFSYVEKVRQELPLLQHRRADLYQLNAIIK